MSLAIKELGNTGLQVSQMGLGLAALGRPGYINLGHGEDLAHDYVVDAMEGRTHRMLDLAYEKGVRYFDAARSYGRAEKFLRSWLEKQAATDIVVGSKWGYIYTAEWQIEADKHEIKRHTLEVLNKQWEKSSKLLPWLKLYQIHSATFESGVLENTEVLSRLAELKAEGVAIGVSVSGPRQAEVIEAAMLERVDGVHLFDSVQATYNILEPSVGPVLQQVAEVGLGVIVKEALANGRLTPRNRREGFVETKAVLEEMMQELNIQMDMLALAYVLHQPWAQVVLSGAAVETHLKSNLAAARVELSKEQLERLATLTQNVKAYWTIRQELAWN
ncbi:MAG TPA: aldo/keto reductase [Saprospiraceae bacterium]|nr:aldo/keto reductase [Saprospiraceae bacterium]